MYKRILSFFFNYVAVYIVLILFIGQSPMKLCTPNFIAILLIHHTLLQF